MKFAVKNLSTIVSGFKTLFLVSCCKVIHVFFTFVNSSSNTKRPVVYGDPRACVLFHIENLIAAGNAELQYAIFVAALVVLEPSGRDDLLAEVVLHNHPAETDA